ncbi:MAG: cupredoxin domain-containing protein [Nitrososphaeraceae archaeon]
MNLRRVNYPVFILVGIVASIIYVTSALNTTNPLLSSAFAAGEVEQNQQPNIKASNIYQTHTMALGKNIKNLIIEIPNEGHEDPTQPKELRVVNQPYLPRNAIVNTGTTVTWFNADAGHKHQITLLDNKTQTVVYESGLFDNFAASKPIKFNNTGAFAYSGPSNDKAVPNYKMNGTLTVINQPLSNSFNTTSSTPATSNNIDTVSTIIVPAKILDKISSDLRNQGFGIDNQYPFKSLRGGGGTTGGDKNQAMLVLTSSGKSLNQVISALNKVVPTMGYS